MTRPIRQRLSKLGAQIQTVFGRPRGFFTQYDHVASLAPVTRPYPEVEQLFAAAPWRDFLARMGSHVPAFQRFTGSTDPVWNRGTMFSPLDGAAAYTAVKTFAPKRIIEIGSGDSTFYLAKAGGAQITCIDPAPRRSIAELPVTIVGRVLNESDVETCAQLDEDDILFIDSSHIMLPGMDVDIQFNRIFPRLKSGVIVHVHDIFLPDDYPAGWRERRYSEQNALVGWLMSGYLEVVYPGYYVTSRHQQAVEQAFPDFAPIGISRAAGSLWLKKR
jgi:predicted O-methyltransferase YrrM